MNAQPIAHPERPDSGSNKRPNVVLILMDDMGFSDPGCYGGEIATPHLDALASQGLRFTNFYNTGRCWPTRACTLTGYYPPQVCMDPPDQVNFYRPEWQRTLPHYLRELGYRSYHSGKWHIMNEKAPEQLFDVSWGYSVRESGHYFGESGKKHFSSTAITDHALDCLRNHHADHAEKPFFQYVCYTAPHFPVQAEEQDVARYAGAYDEGWDRLRERRWERMREMGIVQCGLSDRDPRLRAPWYRREFGNQYGPGEVPYALAWHELTDEQRAFQATKMSIHAAMVDRTDREIGRLLDQLRAMQVYDDTLVLFLSDNGASAEILLRGKHDPSARPGSEDTYLCLGPGWSTCANTPFRRHKIWVHEGGVSTPLIASWPNGIKARGKLCHDMGHCVDFVPTILDLAGMPPEEIPLPPGAPPLPGQSLRRALVGEGIVERPHIYFHHSGNRALRVGKWKIVSGSSSSPVGKRENTWELYDLELDRCEMHNLAAQETDTLQEMIRIWEQCEATYRADSGFTGTIVVGDPEEESDDDAP